MSTKSYVINFTDPSKTTITIPAGDSLGPYSNTRLTDIELLGMGHTFWGEKINENILHMLENFASNEDLHPIASVSTPDTFVVAGRDVTKSFAVGGSPANTIEIIGSDSNDGTYPIFSSVYDGTDTTIIITGTLNATAPLGSAGESGVPDKSSEFSPITAITGQLWYNQTAGKLLVFNQIGSPLTAGVGDWKPLDSFTVSTTPPGSASEGDLWWDTAVYGAGTEFYGRNLNIFVSGWQRVVQDYLPRDGSKAMVADLNMGSKKITSLALPILLGDGVNKSYTDSTFVYVSGTSTMSGNLDMGSNKIINLATPTNTLDGVNKSYADSTFVKVGGDTMSGELNMNTFGIRNIGAPLTVSDALNQTAANAVYLRRDGTTSMIGSDRLTLNGDPTVNLHAATKQYVDNKSSAPVAIKPILIDSITRVGGSSIDTGLQTAVVNTITYPNAKFAIIRGHINAGSSAADSIYIGRVIDGTLLTTGFVSAVNQERTWGECVIELNASGQFYWKVSQAFVDFARIYLVGIYE